MNFKEFLFDGKILGWSAHAAQSFFFFGNKYLEYEILSQVFGPLHFNLLKQVHGTEIYEAPWANHPEGDGGWTVKKNEAVGVQTADCVPILISDGAKVMALHAGWRGIDAAILKRGLVHFQHSKNLTFALGPHIRKSHFEVGQEVAEKFSQSKCGVDAVLPHPVPGKAYVDLEKVLLHQLRSGFSGGIDLYSHPGNTMDHPDLHSFRLSGGKPGRQWSFVALV